MLGIPCPPRRISRSQTIKACGVAARDMKVVEVVEEAANSVKPRCKYFTVCGGCSVRRRLPPSTPLALYYYSRSCVSVSVARMCVLSQSSYVRECVHACPFGVWVCRRVSVQVQHLSYDEQLALKQARIEDMFPSHAVNSILPAPLEYSCTSVMPPPACWCTASL